MGPRKIASRLAAIGEKWSSVHAVVLTHTHGDHWNSRTLAHLRRERIPLYCHPSHAAELANYSRELRRLEHDRLVHPYSESDCFRLGKSINCRPLAVRHDSGATFAFRFEGDGWALAYAADLGCWTPDLACDLADVDVLCLEFNHDVEMERQSGRPDDLIDRVLSDDGHLSNDQAAALLRQILQLSTPGRVRHLIQLHLSRQCNQPSLAANAARAVLNGNPGPLRIHTASQDWAGPVIVMESANAGLSAVRKATTLQWLPGWVD
jgi:phosphoribosyl 1,2-cyclic phosphodiesterase